MTALFIVRAEINHASDREPFDRWYEQEHLPQAAASFQAVRAWRGWSEVNPSTMPSTNFRTSRLPKSSWIRTPSRGWLLSSTECGGRASHGHARSSPHDKRSLDS
jgi:hypothetical protein